MNTFESIIVGGSGGVWEGGEGVWEGVWEGEGGVWEGEGGVWEGEGEGEDEGDGRVILFIFCI